MTYSDVEKGKRAIGNCRRYSCGGDERGQSRRSVSSFRRMDEP